MPGVPSGRGCYGCRKQKKKCDAKDGQCSRCRRLDILCVGSGVRRFKFIEDEKSILARFQPVSEGRREILQKTVNEIVQTPPSVRMSPTNAQTYRVSSFIDLLNPARGVKFNPAWSYGDYLYNVPNRLGKNEALDAAADAFIAACERFMARRANHSSYFLEKYVEAVRALRICLEDPVQATSVETLCAVMLLLVCQVFVPGKRVSHSAGAAEVFRHRRRIASRDVFEQRLLATLRGPVLFEALFNKNIALTDEEWSDLVSTNVSGSSPEDSMMHCLVTLPNLVRRSGLSLWSAHDRINRNTTLEYEARSLRDRFQPHLDSFRRQFLASETCRIPTDKKLDILPELKACHELRMYAVALFVGIVLNYIVCVVAGAPEDIKEQSSQYAEAIVDLAKVGARFRPLGGTAITLSLHAASFVARDSGTKSAAERLLFEFELDYRDMEALG